MTLHFPDIWLRWASDLWSPPSAPDSHPTPWAHFRDPLRVLTARTPAELAPLLDALAAATAAGHWVAGYLHYEAAPAFDPAMQVAPSSVAALSPIACFGVYSSPEWAASLPPASAALPPLQWQPAVDDSAYLAAVARIREYIAAGDTYQVNLTYPLEADLPPATAACPDAAHALWRQLLAAQPAPYAAYLDCGSHAIASVAPELFFAQAGARVVTRPMKGTSPRGRWTSEDEQRGGALQHSAKNRAENLMIVDLLRNDLGRVATSGTVHVDPLFALERYPTLWQLTSTIAAQSTAHPVDVLRALFPCGSITGAPKIRTMQIIAELEPQPRGIYTGAIGAIGPDSLAQFSVAIRTAAVDRMAGRARYGVGGGVTWDSCAGSEHAETRLKAQVLIPRVPDFELLETMRWNVPHPSSVAAHRWLIDKLGEGCELLYGHLARLRDSAGYFGFHVPDEDALVAQIDAAMRTAGGERQPLRLRLSLARDGHLSIVATSLTDAVHGRDGMASPLWPSDEASCWRVRIAAAPVNSADPFLCHKTTQRAIYAAARAAACVDAHACDDVLLHNENGELTESTIANIVLPTPGGAWLTPPRSAGLLAGVRRARLLAHGCLAEATIPRDALQPGMRLWLVNALRGWLPAVVVE